MIYDVAVIGAGPAGLSAGLSSKGCGAKTLVIEREVRPGGILKQCIHDGFGLIRFNERLSGPEYAQRYIKMVKDSEIELMTSTFVHSIEKKDDLFELQLLNSDNGVFDVSARTVVIACGCRERTPKQVFIHGTRPAGVYTAGTAQYFVNVQGFLPCKKCVILGSGDIGLIMARRLTLEGACVEGVYEAKPVPSGLSRNIVQCLEDYSIPLHLSTTVSRIIGSDRIEGVETAKVDQNMQVIPGSEKIVECDGLILSVGLIPENEIAEMLNVEIDPGTKGPVVDQNLMSMIPGVFACGNALHVNDLVDYVTQSGEKAGASAAKYSIEKRERNMIRLEYAKDDFMYVVPQYIDLNEDGRASIYFRSKNIRRNVRIKIQVNENDIIFERKYSVLKPPEMEKIDVEFPKEASKIRILMQEA